MAVMLVLAAATAATIPTSARFECGRTVVVARFTEGRATLNWDRREVRLAQVRAASGARYAGVDGKRRRIEFWTKGEEASFTTGRKRLPTCRLAELPVGASSSVPAPGAIAYRALGTEPFWNLTLSADRVSFSEPASVEPQVYALPPVRVTATGRRYEGGGLVIDIAREPCSDGMSERRYPERVRVEIGSRVLEGCGADAATWPSIERQPG